MKIRKNTTQLNAVCCFYHNFLTHNNEWGWCQRKIALKWFYSRNMAVYNAKGILVYDYVYQLLLKDTLLQSVTNQDLTIGDYPLYNPLSKNQYILLMRIKPDNHQKEN